MASQNQLSRYGAISRVIPGLHPAGRVFIVADSDDTTVGPANLANDFGVDDKGVVRVYSTIQAAVNACDSRGDVVLVSPYHTEDFERADTWNVAGVQIIGMGEGEARPTLRYDTGGATVQLRANGLRVSNLIFLAGEDSIDQAINMDTGFFGQRIDHCTFTSDSVTDDFQVMVRLGAKESIIEDNEFLARDTAGAGRAISIVGGDPDFSQIRRNYFYGQYDTVGDTTNGAAVIATDSTNVTDATLSGLRIEDNTIVSTDTAAAMLIRFGGGGVTERGIIANNILGTYDTATADTAQVSFGGILPANNVMITADSDVQQSIVGTRLMRGVLDSG